MPLLGAAPMDERTRLCESISTTIADYRVGEFATPTSAHVDRWVQQFDADVQAPLLAELDHALARTYFSRARVEAYFRSVIRSERVGRDPSWFWRSANFLNLQVDERSQGAMLAMFDQLLRTEFGLTIDECAQGDSTFLYLDDGVFSGNQISRDIARWIEGDCPARARVEVVCLARHTGGEWNAIRPDGLIAQAKERTGKEVYLGWWSELKLENRLARLDSSDVLVPTSVPHDSRVREYAAGLDRAVTFRTGQSVGGLRFFSSADGRHLLEQELLKTGVRVREVAPNLNGYQRPLGNTVFESLGFGSMIVTYRNCPNNAPLALWVGDPWYPLFPRRTN